MSSGLALIPQSYYFEFHQRGVNVKDYGAKGDGTTDDSTAFQNAFAAGIDTVIVPAGTYVIATWPTNFRGNIRLIGEHKASVTLKVGSSITVSTNQLHDLTIQFTSATATLDATNCLRFAASHIAVSGSNVGLYLNKSQQVTIDDSSFIGTNYGIQTVMGTSINNDWFNNICILRNVSAKSTSGTAALLSGLSVLVDGGDFEGSSIGLHVYGGANTTSEVSQNVQVRGCYFEANTANDLIIENCRTCTVTQPFFNGENSSGYQQAGSVTAIKAINSNVTVDGYGWTAYPYYLFDLTNSFVVALNVDAQAPIASSYHFADSASKLRCINSLSYDDALITSNGVQVLSFAYVAPTRYTGTTSVNVPVSAGSHIVYLSGFGNGGAVSGNAAFMFNAVDTGTNYDVSVLSLANSGDFTFTAGNQTIAYGGNIAVTSTTLNNMNADLHNTNV